MVSNAETITDFLQFNYTRAIHLRAPTAPFSHPAQNFFHVRPTCIKKCARKIHARNARAKIFCKILIYEITQTP